MIITEASHKMWMTGKEKKLLEMGEQMIKIGTRLALMAKRCPEMAQAMLEELQDQ